MAYSTSSDLQQAAGGSQALLQLVDVEVTGDLEDAGVVARMAGAIQRADEWINSYAQKRYAVPFSPVPSIIARYSAEEAAHILLSDRRMMTEASQLAHDERERWLDALSKGRVSPGTEPSPPKSSAVVPETFDRSPIDGATRDSLKGFC